MKVREAACSCGALSVRCAGEPTLVSACHCLACQRRTGSAFGIAAFFPRETVEVRGRASAFTRPSDTGFPVTFHFCPACGSTIYWTASRKPDLIAVAAGAFADPDFPPPTKAAHQETRHSWACLAL